MMKTKKLPPIEAWPPNKPGQPYGPQEVQKPLFILNYHPKDRPHNHPADVCLLIGGAGSGKSLLRGTVVIKYDGSLETIENIKVGDLLMGPDSKPRKVLELGRGREVFYKVSPIKGEPFYCNESHILSLRNGYTTREKRVNPRTGAVYIKPHSKYFTEPIVNISIKDYLKWTPSKKKAFKLYRAGEVSFPTKSPRILEPYALGLWLGDGNSNTFTVSNIDYEILEYLRLTFPDHHETCPKGVTRIAVRGMQPTLRILNLVYNKHIPHQYKTAPIPDRLQLLAGLLDSDGHYQNRGHFEITQKNKTLAEDIVFVCRSLGLAAYMKECRKACIYKGEKRWGTYYKIQISGDLDKIPTKVKRKQATPRGQIKNHLNVGFKLEKLEEDDYYGVVLDGDHLFLLGDFTVVHNTISGIAQIIELVVKYPGCKAAVGGKNFPLLKRNVVDEFGRRFSAQGNEWDHPLIRKKPTQNEMMVKLLPFKVPGIETPQYSQIQFINLDKYEVARGFNADVILIEEANLMSGYSFEEMVRRSRGRVLPLRQFILTMNPTGDRDWVHTKFALRQYEPGYDGPPIPIGQPCQCQYCQLCLHTEKGKHEWVGGEKAYADYTDIQTGKKIPNRLYEWKGGHCPSCGKTKETNCPGNQYWYRVIRSKAVDNQHNPDTYVSDLQQSMDPEMFRLFGLGEIIQVRKGKVYKSFTNNNVLPQNVPFNPNKPIIWSHDFNRDPMCSVLWQEDDETGIHVFDEIVLWDGTEELAAREFCKRYGSFKGEILIYGDPAGLNVGRNESRRTSFQIMHDVLKLYKLNSRIMMERIPGETRISIYDRVNNTNAILRNAKGEIRLRINPSCNGLINSLASVNWDDDGKKEDPNIDKLAKEDPGRLHTTPPMTHPGAAAGYGLFKRAPLITKLAPAATVVTSTEIRTKRAKEPEKVYKEPPPIEPKREDDDFLKRPNPPLHQQLNFGIGRSILNERLEAERKEREAIERERLRIIQELQKKDDEEG